jgi:predicted transcriptional regulator
MPRSRLTLDLSPRMDTAIEQIASKHSRTKADVLRRALSLLFACDRAKEDGFHVGAFKTEGNVRTEREFVIPI